MSNDFTVPNAVRSDRFVGVVLGSAAGDALGAGYEFGSALPADQPVHMNGGGAFAWEPGEWTDDTQMALAILTPLAAGHTDLARIESGFRAWFNSGPTDVGAQTSAVLRSTGPLADAAAAFTAARPNNAAGNGSLMRTGPIALAHPANPTAIAVLARAVSALTHPDPDCIDACILWSVAIDHTIHHAPASDQPWDWAKPLLAATYHLHPDRQNRWRTLINTAATSTPTDFPHNGWVIHAFQAALAAVCSTPIPDNGPPAAHIRHALETAVRAGGDTDTVAAIAGSLLGARWGATALPFAWRRRLHGHHTYNTPPLHTADLERLARLAAVGGHPDQNGWPTATTMIEHYNQTWPSPPLRTTLGGVEFGNISGVADAITDGADTIISLCRMGRHDIPSNVEHHTVGLLDTTKDDNPNLDYLLTELVAALETYRDEDRHVYVHCVQAENRTPTIAAAWLHHLGTPATQALTTAAHALNQPKPFLADAVKRLNLDGKPAGPRTQRGQPRDMAGSPTMSMTWDVSWAEPGIRTLAEEWRRSPHRPQVPTAVLDHWDELVSWWVENPELPLPVRAVGTGRGSTPKVHGRTVVYVDNSPPQWIFARACTGWAPSHDELKAAIATEMPVAQILRTSERANATLTHTLGEGPHTSQQGLKLHHISTVSLGGALAKRTLPQLQASAVRLLSPRNMFVLPKSISGLGEIQCFIAEMAK